MKTTTQARFALLSTLLVPMGVAFSQQAFAQSDDGFTGEVEEVITTGTRAQARSSTQTTAPVDVVSGEDFINQADTDLSSLLRNLVPSYNVNTQPISDAATIARPANLRGLAPDHTLVLVNGKRRHRSAVIYWLGNGVADGAQGPDLSAIPSIALKQVEVLRDGAASQYGSDAIAGVMNFILRDDTEGATLDARYSETGEGDGATLTIAGNVGLPLTDSGFANLSFEYGNADPTDRSVQRNDAAALIAAGNTAVANPAQIWGSPEIEDDLKLWGNFGLDLGNGMEAFMHANYSTKRVDGGFFFRNPNTRGGVFSADGGETLLIGDLTPDLSGNCPTVTITDNVPDATALNAVFADPNCFSFQELFPGGFTPRFGGDVYDSSLVAGVNGEFDVGTGLRWEASAGVGRNEVDFFIRNTVNASLGPATPTFFDPGAYTQLERSVNLDFGYNPVDNFNLAFGAEYRLEEFTITTGQQESFEIGPLADQGFSAASNGFPGFSNLAGGDFSRENVALYVDGEWDVTDQLILGAAIRWEDFTDFGTTTNYKIGANWRATDNFGVRSTFSTGFKAPTPGQQNAFNVSTEFDADLGDLVNNGTVPSTTAAAQLNGGQPLQPEESDNFTFGVFFNVGGLDVTIDYFSIDVEDRLNLSNDFALTPVQLQQLLDAGVTSAANLQNFRFFINDFDTETTGFDIVGTYPVDWSNGSTTNFSLAYNQTDTEVVRSNAGLLDDTRRREIEEGLPETRYNIAANHSQGNWRALARVSYFDDWFDSEDGITYDGEFIVDAEFAYNFDRFTVIAGGQNIFDTVPDENPGAADGVGNRYSQFSPFGFNGSVWYLRGTWDFN